jgi:hypothetical protein
MADSVFAGLPGGNTGGTNTAIPSVTGNAPVPALGTSTTNPLTPSYPTGSASAPMTFPAYGTGGASELSTLETMSPSGYTTAQPNVPGGPTQQWYNQLTQAFHKAGYPSAVAGLMAEFLASGAGYNPAAIQGLLNALGPQIASGQANIMEQFGAEGLSSSSPAALGLAGFDSQVTLDEGQIISQMYEQSVSNYMNVLLAGKESQTQGLGALIGGIGSAATGLGNLGLNASNSASSGSSSAPVASSGGLDGLTASLSDNSGEF